jgi:hypothetical protein
MFASLFESAEFTEFASPVQSGASVHTKSHGEVDEPGTRYVVI